MKCSATVLIILMSVGWWHQVAEAKVGWAAADIVLDFGVNLEPGDQQIIVEQSEVGYPFQVDVVWRLHPQDCLIQALQDVSGSGQTAWRALNDDQLFNGNPAHAKVAGIHALAIKAQEGTPCRQSYILLRCLQEPRSLQGKLETRKNPQEPKDHVSVYA